MKRPDTLAIVLLATLVWSMSSLTISAQYPWVNVPSPITSDFTSVSFPDSANGYITSESGEVFCTRNGGKDWEVIYQLPHTSPTRIFFIDAAKGWIIGNSNNVVDSSAIYHTTDSAKTWEVQFYDEHFLLYDIQFLNQDTGWVAGYNSTPDESYSLTMFTTTGGFSWTEPFSPRVQNRLYSIDFADANNGAACGESGLFLQTSNGGMDPAVGWSMNISIPSYGKNLYNIASSGDYGCAVGQDGIMLVTQNKWTAHQDHYASGNERLNAVAGYDGTSQFYAVGEDGIIVSIRFALYFWMITEETRITDNHLNDICSVNDQFEWAVGDQGTILFHTANFPPVAVDDAGSVRQDSVLRIYVLENDTDPDFDPLEISSFAHGKHGIAVHPAGEDYLEFHPDDDYVGMDTLQYVITDGKLGYDTANIYVEIREVPPGLFELVEIPHDTVAFGNAIWGDIDGDRDYDLIVSGEQPDETKRTHLYMNEEGTFVKSPMEFEGVRAGNDHAMAFTNISGYSYLDFIITGVNSSGDPVTLLYIYNPANGYQEYETGIPGVKNGSVDWGDYDRDGDYDLLISGSTDTEKICRIYRNDGRFAWTNEYIFTDAHVNFHGLDYGSARFVDFNNDRYMDVVSAGSDAADERKTYYYTNLEGLYVVGTLDSYDQAMVDVCDYNGDGHTEILLSGIGEDGLRKAELIAFDGSFIQLPDQLTGLSNGSTSWGDYDNDGDYDLLMSGLNDQFGVETHLYMNNSGTLEASGEYLPGMASGTVQWGDYDADGDLDILMSGYFNSEPHRITRIFRNTLEVENARPHPPSEIHISGSGIPITEGDNLVLISWAPATDSETASEGITYNMTIQRKKNHVHQVWPVSNREDFSEVAQYGNVADTAVLLNSLEPGGLYMCRLQSIDAGYQVSDYAGFEFNTPSVFFEEQDFSFNGGSLSSAEWFRDDSDTIPKLLLSLTDQSYSHLLQWSGSSFDTLSDNFMPGSGHGQLDLLDFNHDNQVDFSEYAAMDSSIKIYITGVDTLTLHTGIRNASYDWGDYDRDGDPDLIITGNITPTSHITKLYRNNGGTLEFYNTLIPGVQEGDIAWVDFDGDGDDDVAITGYNSDLHGITHFYENREGGFVRKEMDLPGIYYSNFDFADYDGDGDMDMLICGVTDEGPLTKVYNNNQGNYIATSYNIDHVMQGSCRWADLYADGKSDIILLGNPEDELGDGKYTGIVYAFYDGDYVEVARMEQVPGPIISLGDFNADKSLDFAFAGSPGGDSRIWLFRNKTITGGGIKNMPRNLDVTVYGDSVMLSWDPPTYYQPGSQNISYNIRLGTEPGAGNLISPLADPSGYRKVFQYGNVPFGKSKMIYGLSTDSAYYVSVQTVSPSFRGSEFTGEMVFNPESGSLIPVAVYLSNRTVRNADFVDIDSDSDPDLLIDGVNTIDSYENIAGEIDFSAHTRHIEYDFADELLVTDCDNDNDADFLLLSSTNPTLNKMMVNQSGNFSSIPLDLQGLDKANAAWGELDNDGHPDMFVTGQKFLSSETDAYLYVWREGEYEAFDHLLEPTFGGEVHWVDIDSDGDLDLIHFGRKTDINITSEDFVLLINRNIRGAFDIVEHDLPGLNYGNLAFGDYDNDGDPDMLYTGSVPLLGEPRSYICENAGGNFEIVDSITPLFNASAKWADINNDGLLDIVVSGYNDQDNMIHDPDVTLESAVFLNRSGSFEKSASLRAFRFPVLAVADVDGDGRQDIFIGGYSNTSDTLGILYRNMFSDINEAPPAPSITSVNVSTDSAEIHWARAIDGDAGDNMLYYNLRVGTSPGACDVVSPLAHAEGTRIVQGMGNVQQSVHYALHNLAAGTTYYAAVQSIDKGMAASAWSEEEEFTTLGTPVGKLIEIAPVVRLYPVPVKEQLTVEVQPLVAGEVNLEVTDVLGRTVFSEMQLSSEGMVTFHVDFEESGLFLATIRSESFQVVRKIVVKKDWGGHQ